MDIDPLSSRHRQADATPKKEGAEVMKNIFKFIKFFLFYMLISAIALAIFEKVVNHVSFMDINFKDDWHIILLISLACSLAQLRKRDKSKEGN